MREEAEAKSNIPQAFSDLRRRQYNTATTSHGQVKVIMTTTSMWSSLCALLAAELNTRPIYGRCIHSLQISDT